MKKLFILFFSFGLSIVRAQDAPTSCENPVSSFNDVVKAKITSQVRTAYQYYMTSTDPGVGNTYGERTANLQKEIAKTIKAFMDTRRVEYRKTICSYYKTTRANAGNSKMNTITVQPGFNLITATIDRTMNGDWKGGPSYSPNETTPTSITWKTGGHSTSNTYVNIKAKYNEDYIKTIIQQELAIAKNELNDLGIPIELPPFLDE